ncbi:long-chain fatty acid transporter FadL [Mucilaginibacter koreensis]
MRKLLLFLALLCPALTFAQGFQVNLQGQQQIGMGHTGVGLAQDGASLFFNPGAMANLTQNYVQGGISPLVFKSNFNPANTPDQIYNKNRVATPFSAYAVWGPQNARWKVGFGVYTPFGGLTDWGNDWIGKYAVQKLDLKAISFQPTVGYKISDFISIGAGFVYTRGIVDLTRAIPLASADNPAGQAELKGSGHGLGWNAGVYLKPFTNFTVGVAYRSRMNTVVKNGDAFFRVPQLLQSNFPQPNNFYASIPLPASTNIGFGYKLNNQWLFALDGSLVNWSAYKELAFDYKNNTATLQDTHSPRNYKNAFSLRAGAQYKPEDKWALRAGGGYVSTAVRDGYVTPEVPDANRYYLTGGIGYNVAKHFNIDLSFEYEHLMSRTQTNIETQLSGTFKTDVYIPGIGITYHW